MSFLGRNKSPRCLSTYILFSFSDPNSIMCLCILIFQQISSMIYVYVLSHVSNSLRPHGLYHARLPCPLLSPRICSNSCPLSRWCHPTVSYSPPPALNLSQHQGLFQPVCSSHQVAKVLELQLQHQSFQWIFRVDFLFDWFDLLAVRDSQESFPTSQFKSIDSSVFSLPSGPTSYIHSWCNPQNKHLTFCAQSRLKPMPPAVEAAVEASKEVPVIRNLLRPT